MQAERASRENENEERSDVLFVTLRRFAPLGAPLRTVCVEAKCAVIALIANSLQQQQVRVSGNVFSYL